MQLKATTPFGWVVRGCLGLSLFGCIGLFVLGTIVSALGFSPTTGSSPIVATTFAEIDADLADTLPTVAPKPTETLKPTAAPESVAVSEPAAETTVNELTEQESEALLEMSRHMEKIGTGLQTVGELASKYDGTDAWKVDMVAPIGEIQAAHQALVAMDVPSKLQPFHGAVVRATVDCSDAMDKMASGIDNNDIADIGAATTLMQSCATKLTEAQPELQVLMP